MGDAKRMGTGPDAPRGSRERTAEGQAPCEKQPRNQAALVFFLVFSQSAVASRLSEGL